jgi:hypothetical protein
MTQSANSPHLDEMHTRIKPLLPTKDANNNNDDDEWTDVTSKQNSTTNEELAHRPLNNHQAGAHGVKVCFSGYVFVFLIFYMQGL